MRSVSARRLVSRATAVSFLSPDLRFRAHNSSSSTSHRTPSTVLPRQATIMNTSTHKGPVLRVSLRANAEPFTPSGFGSAHTSQPAISRRHSQNPTYVHTTPKKRNSVHGQMRRQQNVQDQNHPPAHAAEKQKATTFSHDAFAKKGAAKTAAKAYAARKRAAMEKANPEQIRKADARKGFERRQSLKLAKKAAAERAALGRQETTADITEQFEPTKELVESVVERVIENETPSNSTVSSDAPSIVELQPDAAKCAGVSDSVVEERHVQPEPAPVAPTSAPVAAPPQAPAVVQTPTLAIETVTSTSIAPPVMAPRSTPVVSTTAANNRNSLSTLPSMSVDIGSMARNTMSSCTMSTVSGDSYPATTAKKSRETLMPSSGKWCDECAGVGLHIAAMMTTMASWRAEEERRSSNTSSSGSCQTKKGGWTRRMSQTLIGSSNTTSKTTSDVMKDKQRLQQQVDVLQLTVNFLYDKLQHHNAVTPEIAAMVRRLA